MQGSQALFNHIDLVIIYAIYAMSLQVLLGYAGQLSVAHAAFGAVGGYMAAYLAQLHGWTFFPALLAGGAAAGVIGVLASLPALYLDPRYIILLTLALATAIQTVAGAIPALGGQTGLTSLPFPKFFGLSLIEPSQFFVFALILALVVLVVCWRMAHSPFGRVLRAVRDDDVAARGIGKNIVRYKVVTFGVTSAMAGLAGVLITFYNSSIQPTGFDLTQSLEIITMIVIGGTANLFGAILGATIITLLDPFLQDVVSINPTTEGLVRLVIYGGLILVFMLVLPQGLIRERWTLARLFTWRRERRLAAATGPDGTQAPAISDGAGALAGSPATPAGPGALAGSPASPTGHGAATSDATAGHSADGEGRIALAAAGLNKHFGGIRAADDLSLQLRTGQITGLIGPNGAGKTTVFNLLTHAVTPDSGSVTLEDERVDGWTPNRIAVSGMVRTYQEVRIFGRMSVLENVMIAIPHQPGERLLNLLLRPLHAHRFEREARRQAMEHLAFVGLADRADAVASSLSFGDQKLLSLARLLATGAEVLLLDEPASGIDIDGLERMLDLIARLPARGKCVCIVEHNLHVVERLADRIYFMEQGRITAEGTMAELIEQERLSEVYFGSA